MSGKSATLHRMAISEQLCPHGLKARDLLQRAGFEVDDQRLESREAVDAFKAAYRVETTPQIFIDGQRIGGYDALRTYLGKPVPKADAVTYGPIIALFSVAALLSIVLSVMVLGTPIGGQTLPWFIAIAMVLLGLQKLQDIEKFATMFLGYDLLARRHVRYGYVYPYIETGAGLLMLMDVLNWLSAPIVLFAAGIGAASVFKAVYVDKRELKCACMGDSRVPLGFVSLVENLMMMGMALWMLMQFL